MGLDHFDTADILGVRSYLRRYKCEFSDQPTTGSYESELQDWACSVEFDRGSEHILCCPEDIRCDVCVPSDARTLCEHCHVPVCRSCHQALRSQRVPTEGLANDMWTGYAPQQLYADQATIIEMSCASVCLTSMVCFSLELKFGNMFNTEVHMQRHRVGARGNVTCVPLPWDHLVTELQALEREPPALPRTGAEVADLVQLLLKSSCADRIADLKHVIHQARVRRHVVVTLILDARARGHLAYKHLDEDAVKARAELLPVDDIPPELIKVLINDDSIDKLQPQKVATPVAGRVAETAAFKHVRPHAVVQERSCADRSDINEQHLSSMRHIGESLLAPDATPATDSAGHHNSPIPSLVVQTGHGLVDQFKPWFFGVAFAFCFKYCIGMPDHGTIDQNSLGARFRRVPGSPTVELRPWCKSIARRIESPFGRDWLLSFAMWNYMFRTTVNKTRSFHLSVPRSSLVTAHEIEEGAIQICKALQQGVYRDPAGGVHRVSGDMTKVKQCAGLTPAAHKLLAAVEHTSQRVEGTQEVRRLMRHQLHAYRIVYGQAVFVTFSPNEKDSLLMIRLSRARRSDPIHSTGTSIGRWGTMDAPSIEHDMDEIGILPTGVGKPHTRLRTASCASGTGPIMLFRRISHSVSVGVAPFLWCQGMSVVPAMQYERVSGICVPRHLWKQFHRSWWGIWACRCCIWIH